MKRDLDLIRKILQICEDHEHGLAPDSISIPPYSDEQIGFHIHLAGEAGLLVVTDRSHSGSLSPQAYPLWLTWAGYEFLESSRDDERWKKAKTIAHSAGSMTLDGVKSILVELGAAAIKKATGLP